MSPTERRERQARQPRRRPVLSSVKFRSSCDQCSEAKVRCGKEHPRCGRCLRTGATCHYSVSMRTGKTTMNLIKALNGNTLSMSSDRIGQRASRGATGSGSDPCLEALGGRSPSPPPSAISVSFQDPGQDMMSGLGPVSSGLPSPPAPGQTTHDGDLDAYLGQDACSATYNSIDLASITECFSTVVDDLNFPIDGSASPGFSFLGPSAMDYCSQQPPDSTDPDANNGAQQGDAAPQQSQTPADGHSCLRTTKALQQSVVMMTSRDETTRRNHGIMASMQPITTTDQALLTCSSISKQLTDILQCRCEADAYLPFLISVIISKLLATYGAIAKADESTLFSLGSKLNVHQERDKERSRQQQQEEAAFASVPLRLGMYNVDGELEGVLRVQLVLHELAKFECVVQLFEEKYCYYEADPKSNERTIYSALCQFIKERFTGTKTACEHIKKSPSLGI